MRCTLGPCVLVAKLKVRDGAKRVTVGTSTVRLASGRGSTLRVKLNATGRRLLKRRGKLTVYLTTTLRGTNGTPVLVAAQTLRFVRR